VIAIIAFVLSSGQIVLQTFQHHHAINPKHGFIKFLVFMVSSLSLTYLAKDIYTDFEEKNPVIKPSLTSQAELDYWHSIYSSPSPEGYCDYLEKYPNGEVQFVTIAKNATQGGNCLEIRRQAEAEVKAKMTAELKAKLAQEAQVLAEKNAQLEKEAKVNAARISALEQAKTEAELNAQAASALETQIKTELNTKFHFDTKNSETRNSETRVFVEESNEQIDIETKTEPEVIDKIF
jgi:hypothetical protein